MAFKLLDVGWIPMSLNKTMFSPAVSETICDLNELKPWKHYLIIGDTRWNYDKNENLVAFFFSNETLNDPDSITLIDTRRIYSKTELMAFISVGMLYIDKPVMVCWKSNNNTVMAR